MKLSVIGNSEGGISINISGTEQISDLQLVSVDLNISATDNVTPEQVKNIINEVFPKLKTAFDQEINKLDE